MEKIKRYNQVVLAILGTIGILFLLVMLIYASTAFIEDFYRGNDYIEENIISEEEAEKLLEENLRKHLVSLGEVDRIDSLNGIYLIPVSQTHLEEPEDLNKNLLGLTNIYGKYEPPFPKYYGLYNNALIYDAKNDKIVPIYNERVSIHEINPKFVNGQLLILMKVTKEDTNKDGKLTKKDLQKLSIYNVEGNKLKELGVDWMTCIDYKIIEDQEEIVLQFGVDRDTNGMFTASNEPKILKTYSIVSDQFEDLVGKELLEALQKTLDGSKE